MAGQSPFKILPWNGYKSALSLTFDDGVPAHYQLAGPELARRGLKATFYVVAGRVEDPQPWRDTLAQGHEIGNHSMDHKRTKDYAPGDEKVQVVEAKKKLEDFLKAPVTTFAYPFTEIIPALKSCAAENHLLCRGGGGADYYLSPESEPDWADIPSQVALTETGYDVYRGWMDQTMNRQSWTLFMLHGIEGAPPGWQPLPRDLFFRMLDELAERNKDFWIATVAEVAAYWKAQKAFEKSQVTQSGHQTIYTWQKPAHLPPGLVLKAEIPGKSVQVLQEEKNVSSLSPGLYPIAFDSCKLVVKTT